MTFTAFLAVLLLLTGAWLDVPIAILLAIVVLILESVRAIWSRNGLSRIVYERHLERDRITWGEEIPTEIETWNRGGLPLSWLRAEDEASPGVVVRERPLVIGGGGGRVLRNAWTLAPFERVRRRFHVTAERRGVYELGPVALSIGDLFAREAAREDRPSRRRFLVRPRVLPMAALERRDTWGGQERTRAGLSEDPSRFAGVRPYAPGDPLRRIHVRASARLGVPVVKRFEPSREREVLLALDVQTAAGFAWDTSVDEEEVESLFVVAASVARSLARDGAAFGLAAAGYHGAESRFAQVAISEAPGQLERVFDLLARLSSHPSAPFERLLGMLIRVVRPGTTILVVTARDPSPYLAWLRRLERAGCRVVVLACGPDGAADAGRIRRLGLPARSARLDGPWRTATVLGVTG
ncbi:MAG TPA: DUF58 domain-containing protein [Candidatus Limnocylindrales bacterium]|nr:DUF58 domain-containing protein [Candidatus Limnocylindrales bacterium]